MSLRLRLLVALVPLFVVGLAAADVGTFVALQSYLLSRVDDQLLAAHPSVEGYLLQGSGEQQGPRPQGTGSGAFPPGTYGEIRSPTGAVLVQQTFGFGLDPSTHPILPSGLKPGTADSPALTTVTGAGTVGRYRVYVDTVNNSASSGGVLIVAIPLDDVYATLARLVGLEAAITAGVTLLLVVATWLIVRRSLRPLVRMGDTARSIAASDLGQRVRPADETTEVGRLGLALNAMLEELEKAFAARAQSEERLRHFVSDASHELRTPLTSMRGYAEMFRRNPAMERSDIATGMRRIEGEAQRMGVLVDDLLLLARLDQGRALERQDVDLEGLVSDACSDARAADNGRVVTARISAPLRVVGDEMRLRQVLNNLLTNARVHTPPGTPVEVRLDRSGDAGVIEVIDHGPGIPAADAAKIFERFHRADPGRSRDRGGSGLGLSIVDAVVTAHGGRISVVATPGGGATFRIELPLAPSNL